MAAPPAIVARRAARVAGVASAEMLLTWPTKSIAHKVRSYKQRTRPVGAHLVRDGFCL